ncbi:DUF4157 domain-containing protein [Sphaerotilus microaerophilus]|uniref:eCIS core domain-containing protein n=1 Tax=Sphaerotilus microaerophilus TaxID=2914710 RepID=A0ABN6PMX9_9BURK|nr:DUF4157 domain-containing protein [Sphaerotilus sp. FB-5]BDI05918.1 hypothetical protein CATMQ487_28880 [Sphaerotilus sp. FB-5]
MAAADAAQEQATPAPTRPPKAHPGTPNPSALIAADVQGLGDGAPLALALRAPIEQRLGADLSAVRVHTDVRAALARERICVRAFAHGQHVAFGEGQYAPQTAEGRRLIAHELAHTVEQGGAPPRVQGDTGADFTVADMQKLAANIDRQEASSLQSFGTPARDSRLRLDLLPNPKTGIIDNLDGRLEWRFGRFVDPKDKYEDVCPTCHQTGAQAREAKQKRDADEKRRKLEAAWSSMHTAQHNQVLNAQESSLAADLQSSRLAVTQARLALLDAALALPPELGDDLLASPTAVIPPELRTHMLMAAQAEVLVDAYVDAKTGAQGIPWSFYLIRKGFMFELHDITAPLRKDGRSVVHEVGISNINALIMQRHGTQSIDEIDPPKELFDKLNDCDFFPESELYWRFPKSGLPDRMTMTAPKPFYQWLTEIGMLLTLVGGLLVPVLGGPAALALASALVGGAMTIGGSVLKMQDMEAKGMLTAEARRGIWWDIALDYNDWVEKTMRHNVPWGSPPDVALALLVATGQRLREIIRAHRDVLHYGQRILPPDLRRVRVGIAAQD